MKNKIKNTCKILLICSIGYLLSIASSTYIPSKKEICANRIRSQVGKEIASEKCLNIIGVGGAMFDEIKMLGLVFQGFHQITLEEARRLIVYALNKFLDEINSDESIRPYLVSYPFSAENLEIGIWLYKPDHTAVNSNHISYVVNRGGMINYYRGEKEFDPLKPILVESAKDAFEMIQREKNSSIPQEGEI